MALRLFRKRSKVEEVENLLNKILYSQITGNAPIVFYDYGKEDFISKGYSKSSDVFKIINKILDKAAVATPYIYVDKGEVKSKLRHPTTEKDVALNRLRKKSLEFAEESLDLVQLLKNPNLHQTWREFISLDRLFYFVQGEMLIYRESGDNNCAISLHTAPSHLMTPIFEGDYNSPISSWRLQLGARGEYRDLPAESVFHFAMPNPNFDWKGSQLRGFSPLTAGMRSLQQSDSGRAAWLKAMENEGAKGIVSPSHSDPKLWLNADQVKVTQKILDQKIHGANNRNKIAVSGMPLKYSQIGLSPDALNIINGLDYSFNDLCGIWGVPPELFNADPTYQNQKEAGKRLVKEVILPYLNAEEDKFNTWLVEPFRQRDGINYVLDYDLSAFEELRLDKEDIDAMLKTHSLNEVRIMQGSDERPEESANEVFVPAGYVPLSDYDLGFGSGE